VTPAAADTAAPVVTFERRGAAAWITLNRPGKVNALNREMLELLLEAFDAIEADEEVRVVVVTGAGGNFSSGYDLVGSRVAAAADAYQARAPLAFEVEVTMRLWALERPTIAVVDGWCIAGGCELAMACDIAIASEEAKFGEPEILYGSGPVTLLMPFVLGEKVTKELLFTGETIDARCARRLGLVNSVVPAADLGAAAQRLVERIVPTPLPILKSTKLALVRAYEALGVRAAVASNLDIGAILNKAETEEGKEFQRILAADGLGAALRWRDARYEVESPN
jgi:enoyl-CoA hydratase